MGESAYLKLYKYLREAISKGLYPYGSRLPSKRTLAADRAVSLVTVEHALAILCDEGYAEARPRSGYFVIYRPQDLFPVAEGAAPLPDSLRGVQPRDSFPFSSYARAVRRVLSDAGPRLLERSPGQGLWELRRALAAYLARSRGIQVKAEQILIGSGAEAFYGLILQLLGKKAIYGLEEPSYAPIRQVYEAGGAVCEALPLGPDGIRSSALKKSRAGVLHVTPYNSYPSGITASASKRAEYLRWAGERGAFLIEDDYDSEFTLSSKAEDTLFSLSPAENVIYINTFSRTIAPALRAGYLLLPTSLIQQYRQQAGFYNCSVPVLEQYVLTYLLESGEFERHINRVRRRLRKITPCLPPDDL